MKPWGRIGVWGFFGHFLAVAISYVLEKHFNWQRDTSALAGFAWAGFIILILSALVHAQL